MTGPCHRQQLSHLADSGRCRICGTRPAIALRPFHYHGWWFGRREWREYRSNSFRKLTAVLPQFKSFSRASDECVRLIHFFATNF
ncbi:hypothetical protein GWI33_010180 [Rhynchophorus ferrugineus]|uniref:Uncharacterized protein n=1 Tax=Rhynchophorus ferrugineus TaxID=354439 RepID=A0A834IXG5_RHYFE|nr:hypothetical protein GWI33_010180 [Rhynchophorus ferrugineus]